MINQEISKLKEADTIVSCFYSALKSGENNLRNVPGLLLRLINEEMWQERMMKTGEIVKFSKFIDFVTSKPLAGLGENLDDIKRLCRDDPKAMDALDRVTVHGQGDRTDLHTSLQCNEVKISEQGNSSQYALRRLRKDRPDLHEQVINRKLTAHAAMVQAGFRRKGYTVQDTTESAARFLAHFTRDQMDEIIRMACIIKERPELRANKNA